MTNVVKKLIGNNVDEKIISDSTGISLSEIRKIKRENHDNEN